MAESHIRVPRRRQAGVSLIELMVALLIGLFLMLGAITVYNQSRATYRARDPGAGDRRAVGPPLAA